MNNFEKHFFFNLESTVSEEWVAEVFFSQIVRVRSTPPDKMMYHIGDRVKQVRGTAALAVYAVFNCNRGVLVALGTGEPRAFHLVLETLLRRRAVEHEGPQDVKEGHVKFSAAVIDVSRQRSEMAIVKRVHASQHFYHAWCDAALVTQNLFCGVRFGVEHKAEIASENDPSSGQ